MQIKSLGSFLESRFFCKFATRNFKIKYFGNTFNRPSYTADYGNSNGAFLHWNLSQSYNIFLNNVHIAALLSHGIFKRDCLLLPPA